MSELKPLEMIRNLRKCGVEIVPDDNGHSWQKFATYRDDGKIFKFKFASVVGDASRNEMLDIEKKPINTYLVNGVPLVCATDMKHPIDIRVDGYQYSKENMALIANGIDKLGLFEKKIILGTTAPIGRQFSDDLVSRIKKEFREGTIKRVGDNASLEIIDVITYGEGLMAAYDWFITDDGRINKESQIPGASNRYLVVDIGGGTTDVVTITNQGKVTVDKSSTGTIEGCGIIDITREIKSHVERTLREAFGDKGFGNYFNEATTGIIEDILLNNGIYTSKAFDITVDMSKFIHDVRSDFIRKMLIEVSKIAVNMSAYDKILFVGGGALLLGKELRERIPGAVYLDEYANAKGLLKLMTYIWLPSNYKRLLDAYGKQE